MAQLEYNLPILILGSSSSLSMIPKTAGATASTTTPTVSTVSTISNTPVLPQITRGALAPEKTVISSKLTTASTVEKDPTTCDSGKSACNTTNKQNTNKNTSDNKTSLCEEKLIPENLVPDIVELLVTLGLIQQETTTDSIGAPDGLTSPISSSAEIDSSRLPQQEALSDKDQFLQQPRFAVHFGKPKQFLVTPTNILSEISKAQGEIQASRQRQELLKEALDLTDRLAAEKVKHIVLQHPQVVDDPVYVTALRNLQVDGMLMAGAPGTTTASNSNLSSSLASKGGTSTPKSGPGGSGKKSGGGKRRQSGGTPAKRKRQRTKKEVPADSGNVASGRGNKAIAPSSSISIGAKKTITSTVVSTESSKQTLSVGATTVSASAPSSSKTPATVATANVNPLKNHS